MRISDWISDVCSSDLRSHQNRPPGAPTRLAATMSARADLVASTKNAAAPIRDNITIATDADATPFPLYGLRQMLHRHQTGRDPRRDSMGQYVTISIVA